MDGLYPTKLSLPHGLSFLLQHKEGTYKLSNPVMQYPDSENYHVSGITKISNWPTYTVVVAPLDRNAIMDPQERTYTGSTRTFVSRSTVTNCDSAPSSRSICIPCTLLLLELNRADHRPKGRAALERPNQGGWSSRLGARFLHVE